MNKISRAVGPGKPNLHPDVVTVQTLLNQHMSELVPLSTLATDGQFGPNTEKAIREFQSRIMRMPQPDGVVDPNGPTLSALTKSGSSKAHSYPAHVTAFINMALPIARKVKAKWGVPVAVIIAQSALETGWGRSVKNNAYFGIKGKSPSGNSTNFATTEVINGKVIHITDQFRAYTGYEDSADDYGRFLNENARYRPAFVFKNNPIKFVEEIAKAGYATDPNYAKSLKSIILTYDLLQYDQAQAVGQH